MRIKAYRHCRQVKIAVFFLVLPFLGSCGGKNDETPLVPPVTSPLSRQIIGFGVINVSYTHVTAEPAEGSASPGYLRQGAIIRILERKIIKKGAASESWVLADGAYRGWLREAVVDIYDNEMRAETASESMGR